MKRILVVPVIVGAFVLSTACAATETASPSTAAAAPTGAATSPTAAAISATPVAKAGDASAPAHRSSAAAAPTKKSKSTGGKDGGDATFPIGAGTHLVLLHSYDSAKHTAVIEPAAFTKDGQSIKGDGSRFTLPVNDAPKIFSTNGGNPDCMDGTDQKTTGSCLATAAWLKKQLGHGGFAVTIANTGDFIYEIAEQYRP
ncbi:hypothetical protein [Actinoplanes sp. TFC3]|uniref:hypothetical protein n=1 Tax=Actinoplanes sp. TFC3 TaxID=1710355 RepID=UPI000B162F39|nr:hypothetical protein [Actinoplanes sp. TFC3]